MEEPQTPLTEEEIKEKLRKEKKKKYDREYKIKNRDRKNELKREHWNRVKSNPDFKKSESERKKTYYENNKEKISIRCKKDNEKHRDQKLKQAKIRNLNLKKKAFDILSGGKCEFCGNNNLKCLTIDHIDGKGYLDRQNGYKGSKLLLGIINGTLDENHLKNLRVLCFNHNLGLMRKYLDLPREEQTTAQRQQTKLWKEAFAFFGPCPCGERDLKFLTISHIHDDGAERRRNGEKMGRELLHQFRKIKWPESLKEDFCLECWNCNCSRWK